MKLRRISVILMTMVLFFALAAFNAFAAVNESLGAPVISGTYDEASGSVTISWETVDGAAQYLVMGCLSEEKDSNLQELGYTTETSYTYSPVTPGSSYYFCVNAWDADGNVSALMSNDLVVECPLPEPEPLAAPVVKASNYTDTGKIKLSWNKIEGAVGYEVYRSTSKSGTYSLVKEVSGTTLKNTSVEVGKTYYYKVRALASDSSLNSEFSSIVTRTCDLPRPDITASNVAKTGKVKLTWDAVEGAEEYKVYRSESRNGTYKLMKTTSGTSYTNTAADACTTYYYKVKAIHSKSAANSAYSEVVLRTVDLPRPVVSVESQTTSYIRIQWDAVEGATSYKVYRSTSKSGSYSLLKTVSGTSFKNTSVDEGKTYYYKVKAVPDKTAATSAYSTVISGKTVPAAPVMNTSSSSTSDSIKISWDKVSGADGYYVYRRYHTSSTWKLVKTVTSGSTTSCNVKDVSGKYYFRVKAYVTADGSKHSGPYGEEIIGRTLPKRYPTVANDRFNFQNTITWSRMQYATSYQVFYRITSTGEWKLAGTVDNSGSDDTLSFVHDVTHGKYYYYRIRGVYEENGCTTYAEYGPISFKQIISYRPELDTEMSKTTVKSASRTTITVTNNGPCGVRFYSEDAKWLDPDTASNSRNAVLYDYDTYKNTGELVKVDSVWIGSGKTVNLLVGVKGSKTRYDSDTAIYLLAYSDGLKYEAYISADSGCMIYRK